MTSQRPIKDNAHRTQQLLGPHSEKAEEIWIGK